MSISTESSSIVEPSSLRMPVIFLPHGGGPLPLLNDPNHTELIDFLSGLPASLPRPKAILMISAHWEEAVVSVSSSPTPTMIYDYSGFPPQSYTFQYPAAGDPALAARIAQQLVSAGIDVRLDAGRGFDHGTFVPLMLMYPAAEFPVVQVSLQNNLDPAAQIATGKAIASLRDEGVLIIGSGMSFHNMRAFFSGSAEVTPRSKRFDDWLTVTLTSEQLDEATREQRLEQWHLGPEARFSHPREEHLLPLLVCFGAARATASVAKKVFSSVFMNSCISAFLWD
jgi:aromatic ring-opening dioxygenase catalytic subunit (LigB family)